MDLSFADFEVRGDAFKALVSAKMRPAGDRLSVGGRR